MFFMFIVRVINSGLSTWIARLGTVHPSLFLPATIFSPLPLLIVTSLVAANVRLIPLMLPPNPTHHPASGLCQMNALAKA
jgi:hypothetical protein